MAAVADGALPVTDEQRQAVVDEHLLACGSVLVLEQRLLHVVAWLDDAGIDVVVLKGSALAHLDYADPSLRTFGDVDLLVRPSQLDDTIALLQDRGYARQTPQLRPGFDRRFVKSVTMIAPDGIEIDVHRTLVDGIVGHRIDLDALFRTTHAFDIAGRTIPALGREERLLHACCHAALAVDPRLMSVRDVAQLLIDPSTDHDRVAALAAAWGGEAVVARAVGLVRDLLAAELDDPTTTRFLSRTPATRERRELACYTDPARGHLAKVVLSLPDLGPRDAAVLLAASLFPARAFRTSRGGARAWLGRGVASLQRLASRRTGTR